MASTKGSLVVLSVAEGAGSPAKIALQTDGSFNESAETEDLTTKDNANQETGLLDKKEEVISKSAEISCSYQIATDGTDPIKVGKEYNFTFAGGGVTHSGKMLVKSHNESYPLNGAMTIQITATTVGAYS